MLRGCKILALCIIALLVSFGLVICGVTLADAYLAKDQRESG